MLYNYSIIINCRLINLKAAKIIKNNINQLTHRFFVKFGTVIKWFFIK